jgi:hypothetical protein
VQRRERGGNASIKNLELKRWKSGSQKTQRKQTTTYASNPASEEM